MPLQAGVQFYSPAGALVRRVSRIEQPERVRGRAQHGVPLRGQQLPLALEVLDGEARHVGKDILAGLKNIDVDVVDQIPLK